ncbi:MAG: recombinase family protein [Oscillospiraceae bacterium]
MPVAKLIAPTTKQEIPKLRVAAYCRVSSNSADQRNSFATQERVYTKYIAEKQEWELVDIFADEGLSGMKADNRPEFQRMIRMCELCTRSTSFLQNQSHDLPATRKRH